MTGETVIVPDFGDDDYDPHDDGCFRCGYSRYPGHGPHRCATADSSPAPTTAPDSPPRVSVGGYGVSQGLTEAHSDPSQCEFEFPNGERCPRIFGHEAYSEHWHPRDSGYSKAGRLRLLAMADEEAAKHGSRNQKAAAKAAARAYRLAADMIEEEA